MPPSVDGRGGLRFAMGSSLRLLPTRNAIFPLDGVGCRLRWAARPSLPSTAFAVVLWMEEMACCIFEILARRLLMPVPPMILCSARRLLLPAPLEFFVAVRYPFGGR